MKGTSKAAYINTLTILVLLGVVVCGGCTDAGESRQALRSRCLETMKKAARYMVEQVSTHGGYVWHYLPDFSRRWGEMEAYDTMIWVQSPGTTSMGHLFLDAYHITGDEYYYRAAQKAAAALMEGQLECGGWNYVVDFAGEESLKRWYETVGRNGWRLEEFQHYYGNATFDDNVSTDAARFLLRMYMEKKAPAYKRALDRAIGFVIESQYPAGGWPQRYPLSYEFRKQGRADYTSFYTFNDGVIGENIKFLIQCYVVLGEERFLEPIKKGMDFYLITQQDKPQAGWACQYTMDLSPAGARTYEPKSLSPDYTAGNIRALMEFYRMTGRREFLEGIPDALDWLESCKLVESRTQGGKYTHPRFVELGTNKALFVHRKGSNVANGRYYIDYKDNKPLAHFRGKCHIDISRLRKEFDKVRKMSAEEATKDSPLFLHSSVGVAAAQEHRSSNSPACRLFESSVYARHGDEEQVRDVIEALDEKGRWLSKHARTSNPYIGEGNGTEATDEYASTYVGDRFDTSPYRDQTDREYLTTGMFIHNMRLLLGYVREN